MGKRINHRIGKVLHFRTFRRYSCPFGIFDGGDQLSNIDSSRNRHTNRMIDIIDRSKISAIKHKPCNPGIQYLY